MFTTFLDFTTSVVTSSIVVIIAYLLRQVKYFFKYFRNTLLKILDKKKAPPMVHTHKKDYHNFIK